MTEGGADNAGSKSKFHEKSVPSSIAHESVTVNVHSPFKGEPIKSEKDEEPEAPYVPSGTVPLATEFDISTLEVGEKQ